MSRYTDLLEVAHAQACLENETDAVWNWVDPEDKQNIYNAWLAENKDMLEYMAKDGVKNDSEFNFAMHQALTNDNLEDIGDIFKTAINRQIFEEIIADFDNLSYEKSNKLAEC